MFSNLLFLIFVFLIITLSPVNWDDSGWTDTPANAFWIGLFLYLTLLGLIYFQNYLLNRFFSRLRRRYKDVILILVNSELVLFLCFFYFFLGAPRFLDSLGFQTLTIAFSLLLYFVGLAVFHISSHMPRGKSPSHIRIRGAHALRELQLIFPFTIPFIVLIVLSDILTHNLSHEQLDFLFNDNSAAGAFIAFAITILLMIIMMIFLPFWIQKIWQCKSLEDSELKDHLDKICNNIGFKHAGLKTWTVLDHVLTAAIIGIVPRYRYVMFSKRLLNEMPEPCIEAVLVHEIGHSYHRHLFLYPFIILGVSVLLGLISLITPPISSMFLQFVVYAAVVALYFRIVFGFFSRLFERQADLYVFAAGIHPQSLIDALDKIGIATGNSHHDPNWHHYSIQERMDFLKAAMHNPKLIEKHHRHVKYVLIVYFILLSIGLVIVSGTI